MLLKLTYYYYSSVFHHCWFLPLIGFYLHSGTVWWRLPTCLFGGKSKASDVALGCAHRDPLWWRTQTQAEIQATTQTLFSQDTRVFKWGGGNGVCSRSPARKKRISDDALVFVNTCSKDNLSDVALACLCSKRPAVVIERFEKFWQTSAALASVACEVSQGGEKFAGICRILLLPLYL